MIFFLVLNLSVMVLARGYNQHIPGQMYNYQGIYNPIQEYRRHQNTDRYIRANDGSDIEPNLVNIPPNLNSPSHIPHDPYHYNKPKSAPVITKDIYVHVAPEEPDEPLPQTVDFGPRRKHYRIIFIKAPSPSRRQPITVNEPLREEKTIIYVLSKKADPSDIETLVQPSPVQPSKPEVFFIKYRTSEEADFAQQKIQEQYDSLGGTTQVSNEETAPVIPDISSIKESQQPSYQEPQSSNQDGSSSLPLNMDNASQYLPPVN